MAGAQRPTEVLRSEVRRIRMEHKFGGGFDIPEDISPIQVLVEEMRRTLGFVRWIEMMIGKQFPGNKLPALGHAHYDIKNSMQTSSTEEAAWLQLWQQERLQLIKVAKLCHDCGVDEQKIALAESQSALMFDILQACFDALELTGAQQSRIPMLLPTIIRGAVQNQSVVRLDGDEEEV